LISFGKIDDVDLGRDRGWNVRLKAGLQNLGVEIKQAVSRQTDKAD
jgi:hypothetical protein